MPFCPQCRDEFEDWVEVCPDCQVRLVPALPEPPEPPEPERRYTTEPLVTVAAFPFPLKAHVFRTLLESEGIPCFVLNENISRVYPHLTYATGGVVLKVRESDAEKAQQILRENQKTVSYQDDITDEEIENEEEEEEAAEKESCPRCNLVITDDMKPRDRPPFFLRPFLKNKRRCPYCGYRWKKEDAPRDEETS